MERFVSGSKLEEENGGNAGNVVFVDLFVILVIIQSRIHMPIGLEWNFHPLGVSVIIR